MEQKRIIALGFFDGVHLGHGALLTACRHMADEMGCEAAALTFSTHPDSLVSGSAPGLINSISDRERLMKSLYGIDRVIALPFDRNMMTMPWRTFSHSLVKKYAAAGLVCGHDFRFGNRGEGTPALLQQACEDAGIPCTVIPEQRLDGITISSTYIRALLSQGDMEQAARFLGHPHIISGTVVPGRHLGRTLGIPTANLVLPEELAQPRKGVYACKAFIGGREYLAVTSLGTRPTVSGTYLTLEPWILDFDGDLYGREITLEFYRFLRSERKFDSLEELRQQILHDAAQTSALLG